MVRSNTDLLNKIKRKAYIPISQNTFTDAELLEVATEEMRGVVLPAILSARQEYYVYKDTSNTLTGEQNQTFNMPYRAIGLNLRELSVTIGGQERNLPRLDIEDRVYQYGGGSVFGFDITNNQINVRGANTGTLNIYYYLRPGDLIDPSNARQITNVDSANRQVTVSSLVTGWSTSTVFDVIKYTPGFDHKAIDLTITGADSGTGIITFTNDLPTESWKQFQIGDWLVQAEKSPVPQLPLEWHEYLAEAVTAYVMESQGDSEGFARAEKRKEELKKQAIDTISPRVDGESKKIVPRRNRGRVVFNSWRWF